MKIAFLGLGLIGGSVARALRASPAYAGAVLAAWTPTGDGPRRALAAGVLDEAPADPLDAVRGADLVILAAPPLACAGLVRRLGIGGDLHGALKGDATVTDVASAKAELVAAATEAGVPFAGGHPMAGRETSGFDAADPGLFRDRPWVVTPGINGGDVAAVRTLAVACGAHPVELAADLHDRLVAAISHVPLLVSAALVEAVAGGADAPDADWPAARALAAGGWRDTTRLARGDALMGAEILASNAEAVAVVVHRYRDRIDEWLTLLEAPEGPDADALRARLAAANARLEEPA
ncbi:MAG TPA: prephenate dehydrogenase/arogenate dehydrogenase family protein [Candidatus Limnocylindrales bacterium]|nr:prephenate dehydrogenase/arogenate dehydrogenase family protein [Candidatus Limnocylindrales bacterium]